MFSARLIYRTRHVLCYIGSNFTNNRRVPALPATTATLYKHIYIQTAADDDYDNGVQKSPPGRLAFMASVGRQFGPRSFKINARWRILKKKRRRKKCKTRRERRKRRVVIFCLFFNACGLMNYSSCRFRSRPNDNNLRRLVPSAFAPVHRKKCIV